MIRQLSIEIYPRIALTATRGFSRFLAVALVSAVVLLGLAPAAQAHEAQHLDGPGFANVSTVAEHGHLCCHGEGSAAACTFNAIPANPSGILMSLNQTSLPLMPTAAACCLGPAYAPPNPPPIPPLS